MPGGNEAGRKAVNRLHRSSALSTPKNFLAQWIISAEDVYIYKNDQGKSKFKTAQMVKVHLVCVSSSTGSLEWFISVFSLMGSRITTERPPGLVCE